jgi:hypothetical protein
MFRCQQEKQHGLVEKGAREWNLLTSSGARRGQVTGELRVSILENAQVMNRSEE